MADLKLSEIEKKKQQLEEELDRIQNGIDESLEGVKKDVSSSFEPKNIIKKYPLPVLGASVLIGFFLGKERGRPSSSKTSRRNESISDSPLAQELKRIVAKKGMSFLMDYLDRKVAELKEKNTEADR